MANYIPSILVPGSKIFIVGEAPGSEEDKLGEPFKGRAGKLLDQLLDQAGINRRECSIANVAREKPPGNKASFLFEDKKRTIFKPFVKVWIEELKNEIVKINPNLIIAMGATACYALAGEKGMMDCRGYVSKCVLVPSKKVLVTWHPQKVGYEWKLGFETVMDLRKAKRESEYPDITPDRRSLNAHPSTMEWLDYLQYILRDHKGPIALDIETTGTAGAHIDILGIADSALHAVSYPVIQNGNPRLSVSKEEHMWQLFARIVRNKSVIMHNGLYDAAVLWHHNHILCKGYDKDTMIATHACWPETRRSLSFLASICLHVPKWKHTSQSAPTMYNAADAANTYGVWDFLNHEMEISNVRHTHDFEMKQVWPAMMLQLNGLEVDKDKKKVILNGIEQRLHELSEYIKNQVGEVNLNSPTQLSKLLYFDMKLPMQYKRRKSIQDERKMTADGEALLKLYRDTKNELLKKIIDWKKAYKLKSFVDVETSPEGKVHTSYNITGATMARKKKGLIVDDEGAYKSFARWSSSASIILPYGSGNLQNIPYKARKIYRAPKGHYLLQADYAQAEAVVVAHCIGDELLKKLFRDSFGLSRTEKKNKYDVHRITAAQNFSVPVEDVTDEMRTVGKRLRHATNYSAGPGVLAKDIGCTMKEAKILLEQFHNICPQLRIWHKEIQNHLYNTRTLCNLLGRTHRFLGQWGDDLFRSAYSYIPQSTVGDLLNIALVRIYNTLSDITTVALQLHDAVYVFVKKEDVDKAIVGMRELMIMPLKINEHSEEFFIDVDFSCGEYWGELEELEI